jgi:hypothetical protein
MQRERLLQNGILLQISLLEDVGNNLVYNLQLAKCLELSKSKTDIHLCFDVSTWFVTRLMRHTIPRT